MPYTINLTNSIWPNGVEDDTNGYAVFKRLGVDKIPVPATGWPKGTKLISPFVYENGKLTGFVDTKAMTVEENTSIYLPYEHIEADFSSINYGKLSIHAPYATVKKASWANSSEKSIPEADFKYKTAIATQNVAMYDHLADIANGVWSEPLWDLKDGTKLFYESKLSEFESQLPNLVNGTDMFRYCSNLTQFDTDLPKLEDGSHMFYECTALTSFSSDLSSLTDGEGMFRDCYNLTAFNADLSSLTNGYDMFRYCSNLTQFDTDLPKLEEGSHMFGRCEQLT